MKIAITPADHRYNRVADQLVERIRALVPTHPEIMTMNNPFDLFEVEGFKCDDLSPSLAQAVYALRKVQNPDPRNPS